MSVQAGLVGLPNVGKSTLFNALTKSQIPAENYPFCTIEPNIAITTVPDERVEKLQKLYQSEKTIPAITTFVDIAGLVKGAASGEGLGNQFLSHIREVDLILNVLRCFDDPNIAHTSDSMDPVGDYHIVAAELALKDMDSIAKRKERLPKMIRTCADAREKQAFEAEERLLDAVYHSLDTGNYDHARTQVHTAQVQTIPLLAAKNFLIVANMAEDEIGTYQDNTYYQQLVKEFGAEMIVPVSAKIEHELSQMDAAEAEEIMNMMGLKQRGLEAIIKATYRHLGLITFFTCGPKEIHAWPIKQGISVREAAGEIHSDLQRGFICADVFNCADLFEVGAVSGLKNSGKIRTEGHDYIVQDGDIVHVKFNV